MEITSPKNQRTYYLHSVASKNRRLAYYFSKDSTNSIGLPIGYEVDFNKNGLPFLRKMRA